MVLCTQNNMSIRTSLFKRPINLFQLYQVHTRGPLECQEGVSDLSEKSCKKSFFHNRALYVRNVNRVSNSCKIGLVRYDFLEMLCI